MAEASYQLPTEGTSGKTVRFSQLLIGGDQRLHEVNINATPDGELYDSRGGFTSMSIINDASITTVAAAFTTQACKLAMVIADLNNTDWVLIGDASVQPIQLAPGDKISIPVNNTNKIYRKSQSGTQGAAVMVMA